jgi:CBS domain containing-hemolysin-like protein
MIPVLLALASTLTTGYLVLLLRSYEFLPLSELKRQARADYRAAAVYSVRAQYRTHIFVFLWSLIGIMSATTVLLLEHLVWDWAVVVLAVPITVVVHAVLPNSRYPEPSLSMAAASAPVMAAVMRFIWPIFHPFERLLGSWLEANEIRGLSSKKELLEIIAHAKTSDQALTPSERAIAEHALTFGDKQISSIMTPANVVKTIASDEVLSPIVLSELHESGFSRFPVIDPLSKQYVGTLYAKDLAELRTSRRVSDVMRPQVYYVNEFSSLGHVLNAFLRTQHHQFLVVNEYEEVVGVVTIEDVLEQILGRKIIDEFDCYDDLRAVARQRADEQAAAHAAQSV